jgi:hypothetical protein
MQTTTRFPLGQMVATPGALHMLAALNTSPMTLLERHQAGDWGDLDDMDRRANEHALLTGARIFSAYNLTPVQRVWVITEAEDDDGVRRSTCLLRPEEY